ncbi:MAG: hypothetical protein RL458_2776, partial [Pseudomonadota bacterium]
MQNGSLQLGRFSERPCFELCLCRGLGAMTAVFDLQKIYIGYFGRAADPSGLDYWLGRYNAGMSLVDIASSFAVQNESKAMYTYLALPTLGVGVENFLNSVYLNLFNRQLDAEGRNYWSSQLAGGKAVGRVIIDIISGAQGDDALIIANKVSVASFYTTEVIRQGAIWGDDVAGDLADARSVLVGVDKSTATVAAGQLVASSLVALDANHAPVAQSQTVSGTEDVVFKGTVAASDVDGDALTYAVVGSPVGGSVSLNA